MGSVFFKSGKEKIKSSTLDFFSLRAEDVDGNLFSFSQLKTKKLTIVVNVASACGYTKSHYRGMNALYDKYRNQGLEILAFPCNQFGSQESKCDADIKKFVKEKYEVKFPIFKKIEVNGANAHEVYKYLRVNSQDLKDANSEDIKEIPWNFSKFFVNSEGKVIGFYPPTVDCSSLDSIIEKQVN